MDRRAVEALTDARAGITVRFESEERSCDGSVSEISIYRNQSQRALLAVAMPEGPAQARVAKPYSPERAVRGILLILFLLSGFAALIYQVVWVRMLGLVFGVTSFAVATVLSAFMAGLALGSFYGGKFIDKRTNPLPVFSCLQIGIAVFALLFPVLVSGLTDLYVFIYRLWGTSFYLFSLLRFAIAFLLLLIPTTLMGATLPVVAKFYVRTRNELGSDVGALYSVNNWGAVLGALAAGFVLIETLGVRETSQLAAAISVAIGLATLYIHRHSPRQSSATPTPDRIITEEQTTEQYPRYVFHIVLWVFAIEGFTSLGYEVVWTRILASSGIVITVYAYSLVVATFIAGLAIGSFLIRKFVDKRIDLLNLLAGIEIGIGLTALLLLPLFNAPEWYPRLVGTSWSWGRSVTATAVWLAVLILVPTTLMGATFPLVSRIYVINFKELGRRIGWVGCLDTLGSIFGAFAGGFILIPLLGMQKSVLLLAGMNILLGLLVVSAHPVMALTKKTAIVSALLILAVAGYLLSPHDIRFVPSSFARGDIAKATGAHVLHYDEGIDATVVVAQRFAMAEKVQVLAINGMDVAGTGRLLETTQILQGHLPLLLHEAQNGKPPKRVLMVGLGSGGTSRALSLHGLEEIHCVELVPGVLRAAKRYFEMLHQGVFDDPRHRVFIQDARTFVLSADTKYDVILDDSIHPAYQGNASLYSRDHFQYCKERLAENGVMSVWVPSFALSSDDLKMICKTFSDVFPHATLWRANNGHNKHMQLIATAQELSIDFEIFRNRLQQPGIRQDLARMDLDNIFTLLNSHWLDEQSLKEYSRDAKVHSDNHPYLAFSAPRSFQRERGKWIDRLSELSHFRTSVVPYVKSLGNTDEEIGQKRSLLATEFDVAGRLTLGFALVAEGKHFESAVRLGEEALKLNPNNDSCRVLLGKAKCEIAMAQMEEGQMDKALKTVQRAIESDPDSFLGYAVLSGVHSLRAELDEAIEAGNEAMKRMPEVPSFRYHLALLYAQKGMVEKARTQLRELLRELPGEPVVERTLKALELGP